MVKLNDLKNVTKVVKELLINHTSLRNDDDLLYRAVCFQYKPQVVHLSFGDVLKQRQNLGLPSFETVRRTRQKVQATYQELRAEKIVNEARKTKETEYREYARGSV